MGGLLAASCAIVALAEAGYATAPPWALFPPVALVWARVGRDRLGSDAYAACHFAVRHLNWLHLFQHLPPR